MEKMLKKAIIFDYDGVIADSLDQIIDRWNESSRMYGNGIKVSRDLVRRSNTAAWRTFYEEVLGIPANKVEQAAAIFKEMGQKQGPPPLFEGIKEVVVELKNSHDLYVLSSHFSAVIKRDLEEKGIRDYFKTVVGYEEVGNVTKPDPKFILQFLPGWNLNPEQIVYIGDTSDEINCGKSAGITTIGCTWGFQEEEFIVKAGPEGVARKPADILSLINNF